MVGISVESLLLKYPPFLSNHKTLLSTDGSELAPSQSSYKVSLL
jgi:hypothetical protein